MAITPGVSFLAQTQTQTSRLNSLKSGLDTLQRQITTGKKNETMSGFGLNTQRLLQIRADREQLNTFNFNLDITLTRMNLMDRSLTDTTSSIQQMLDGLFLRPIGSQNDIPSINTQAQNLLNFVLDLTNVELDGRYLFSGTDTTNQPHSEQSILENNFETAISDWLGGTITTPQLLATTDGFINTELGFSTTISSAQSANVRISKNTELSYGPVADQSGIENVVRTLAFLSKIKQPDIAVDTPTNDEYETVMNHIMLSASSAIGELRSTQVTLSGQIQLATSIQDTHLQDINVYSGIIDDLENVDMQEAVTVLQNMQLQLQASYETTRIISQLTLVNFL